MPLVSERRRKELCRILRKKLAEPLGWWGGAKRILSDEELEARVALVRQAESRK